jgi:hypothetical protein
VKGTVSERISRGSDAAILWVKAYAAGYVATSSRNAMIEWLTLNI